MCLEMYILIKNYNIQKYYTTLFIKFSSFSSCNCVVLLYILLKLDFFYNVQNKQNY